MRIWKYDIKLKTFTKKGIKSQETPWGNYMITGFQGSGKTYFSIFLLLDLLTKYKPDYIFTNIKSLRIPKKNLNYFTYLDEITNHTFEHSIYIIDELSKKYTKNCNQDKSLYSWLQQSRKRGRIVILITQEWKEVPMWLRRPIRFSYTTRKMGNLPYFITTKGDALNMVYDLDTNEWVCPVIEYIIYKRNKNVANLYDTFEPINDL